ncbi:MAG: hypothetical protein ACFFCT_12015 [Candidatus Odinarchaeota archaeon]
MNKCPVCAERPVSDKYLSYLRLDDNNDPEPIDIYVCEQCYAKKKQEVKAIIESKEYRIQLGEMHVVRFKWERDDK